MDWERLLQLNKKGLVDFHIHTNFCDGKNTPEEMVQAALAKGLKAMGFSGHSHMNFDEEMCMSRQGQEEYREEILRLREKYAGQIEIYCGIERDFYDATKGTAAWDYMIGSVHYLQCPCTVSPEKIQACTLQSAKGEVFAYPSVDDTPEKLEEAIEQFYGGDVYALIEDYYETVSQVVSRTGADIIGHFNLICKFNTGGDFSKQGRYFDEGHPRYRAAWQKAAEKLLQENVLFEINTGGISRGYRQEPYPSQQMQEYIRQHGGRFILSSDSHTTQTLCYGFNDIKKDCR